MLACIIYHTIMNDMATLIRSTTVCSLTKCSRQNTFKKQCYGSGSGIRCLCDPWIRDPGWVKSQDPDPRSGMNNPDNFLELRNHFLG
jgi:hypothetical protein